jgi:hypothetical protein
MKIFFYILGTIVVLALILMAFVKNSVSEIESHQYEVLKRFDGFEIRKYEEALFSSVILNSSSYNEISSNGFRQLAGYIFGGNSNNEKIAMTSPVTMELADTSKMMFMVPSEYEQSNLPTPNNPNIFFETKPAKVVAAIRFGGWANEQKIEKNLKILKELLQEHNIPHQENYSFLGYNPPYDVINRRNEIIVEVNWELN